ncbi:MAG: hypothetical protein WBD07_09040 [Vicinamibacterales bacterium]
MPQRIARFRLLFCVLTVAMAASVIGCAAPADDQAGGRASARAGVTPEPPAKAQRTLEAEAAARTEAEAQAKSTNIFVNGTVLPAESVRQLQQAYPVPIAPGRYWYDPVSGAYGRDGEPIAGQMIPGLPLGGPLAANASHGTSGVYVNGRQLTTGETSYIERSCQMPVAPARYWIMATGVGGLEGGPPLFNLGQCSGVPQEGGGARSMSRTYCDANGACTSTGILGSITTAKF